MNKLFSTETSLRLTFLSLSWFFLLSFFFFLFYSGSIKSFSLINTILLFSIIIYNFIYFIILFYEKNFIYLLFTPLFWYKIVSIIFYGFGPLAYYFGNNFTLTFMHSYYFTSQQTLYKIIIIYLIIILTVDLLIIIYNSIFKLNFKNQVQKFDKKLFLYYVLALGFFIKYLIVIPLTISGVGYPGVFNQFTRFILIGLFIAYTLGIKDKFYRKMFYAILFFELLSSFITLSKEPILITIIFATFTVIYYNNNFKRLIINAVFLISIYALIQPIFSVLRSTDSNEFGITSFSELSKAYNTVQFFYSDDFTQSLFRNYQGWWTRVSYVNYQAYAVEAYDRGDPGDTFENIKYIIIPRLFYPDKPNMNPGSRYHSIVSNKFNEKNPNNTGPGLFFEAYWNGGLLYLFMVIFYFSVIMFSFSKIIVQNLIQKKFFIFILIVNAIYLGRGIDDWFTGRYGTFVLYVIVIYLINLLVYNSIQYLISSSRSNKFEKI